MDDTTSTMTDTEILARTIWGEARGEDREGRVAVANVIMNRAAIAEAHRQSRDSAYWWGETPREICLKEWQFSCWLEGDPNRDALLSVGPDDGIYAECLAIAGEALAGNLDDVTHAADHYLNPALAAPAWAELNTPVATIGRHAFYRLIGDAR